ncbi:MAG: MotA/TolQ/ExbB proton channel family protein [Deltaproteobacteria bacterium]|nr:MotA/TolQ/ExbB proton channel family protein [Deltaproteobacteria bacterium]
MTFISEAVEFYKEGKWGMHLILACLLVSMGIIIERIKVLWLDCAENKHALLTGLNQHIMRGDTQAAIRWLSSQKQGPISRILRAGLMKAHRPDKEIQAALDQASLSEVPRIEARTGYLAVLSNAATLAALLGTISGLITTFGAVADADPAARAMLLSAGISEAMHCTAFGLGVAVLIILIYAVIQARTQHTLEAINESVVAEINFVLSNRAAKQEGAAAAG